LASQLFDRVDAAVIVVDLDGIVLYANPFCDMLYGRTAAEMIGRASTDFAISEITPELRTEIAKELGDGRSWEGDFQVRRADGSVVEVHAIDAPVLNDDGSMAGVLSLAFDATRQRHSERQLRQMFAMVQILRDVGETLVSGLDEARVMQTVTSAARRLTDASIGLYLVRVEDDPNNLYEVAALSGRREESTLGATLAGSSPILRESVDAHRPTRFADLSQDEIDPGVLDVIMRPIVGPLRSCLVSPVRSRGGDVMGAMVMAHDEPDHFTADDEQVVGNIGGHAGTVLDIARLFRAAEREIAARTRAEEEQRFLAETSALLSWSLDYPTTFQRLADICVPFLADLCLIDVLDDGAIRRVAAVHADPTKAELVAELEERFAPEIIGPHPAARVVRGGEAEMATEMSEEYLGTTTRNAEHLGIVRALGFTSYMCVPLTARGRTLGALSLVSAGSGRRFGAHDLELAEEVARRAALAIDNARLYAERDYVARALQSSLLPPALPRVPGVRYAARYRAAGVGTEVGGDFYDVFQSGRSAWWFVVGDVSGKGARAAGIAGLARHTLRAVAMERRTPKRVLAALHETLAQGEGQGEFCTVATALLRPDPSGGAARLIVACAGHPPPIIRRANGTVEVGECKGPLLGVKLRNSTFVQQAIRLEPGDTVVLYTDGIIESHHRNQEQFGEARLLEAIAKAANGPDDVADAILAAVRAHGPAEARDDLALVVAEIEEERDR
jgi:PAS domain S-box-containing protein